MPLNVFAPFIRDLKQITTATSTTVAGSKEAQKRRSAHQFRDQFRRSRNQANNAIKLAKKLYVSYNLEANKGNLRKTWNVINELTSRNSGKSTNILEIKVDNKIVSNLMDIADTINVHFTKRCASISARYSRCRC